VADQSGGEFADEILKDLISQGYTGDELLAKFKEQRSKVRPAVERMIEEADALAESTGKAQTLDDLFGTEA
jgi:hypothetical protein